MPICQRLTKFGDWPPLLDMPRSCERKGKAQMFDRLQSARLKLLSIFMIGVLSAATAGCKGDSSGSPGPAGSAVNLVISGAPTTQVIPGQSYSFQPNTTGSAAANLTFSVQNKPAWASFSIATGQLYGTPTSSDIGAYADVAISVTDGSSTATLPAFTINVGGGSGSAKLAWQAPTVDTDGSPLTDLEGFVIKYGQAASSLNASVTVGSPSTTSYTVQNLSSGTWYFAVLAYAADGSQSVLSNVVSKTIP